jgi:hypothetical protein
MQGRVGHHRIEAAEFVGDLEDVTVPPHHRDGGEALLGPLEHWLVDVHGDDMWNALRQASGQEPIAAADVEHRRCVRGNAMVEPAVVMNVDVPRICHESSLNAGRVRGYKRGRAHRK